MTEVPEYLLQRSRDRRRALGLEVEDEGDGGEAGSGAPAQAEAAGAAAGGAAAAAPTVPAPIEAREVEPATPTPPWVEAAKRREKPPIWVAAALLALPLWAFLYVALLGEAETEVVGPLALGEEVFSSCTACHGSGGGGGSGPAFTEGEVVLTFPELGSHVDFVAAGSVDGEAYGDPGRPGGQRVGNGAMPAWGESLTEAELYAVVRYEREVLGGEELDAETLAERDAVFAELESGQTTLDEALAAAGGE